MRTKRKFDPDFGKWLKERRGEVSQLEYATRAGVSPSYLSQMEVGLVPHSEVIKEMAEKLGDSAEEWLKAAGHEPKGATPTTYAARTVVSPPQEIEGTADRYTPKLSTSQLPVKGTLRGGKVTMVEEIDDGEIFPCLQEHAEVASYVVRVVGDSLFPLILEGDFVAVKDTDEALPGQIIVVQIDDDILMKRYVGRKGGRVQLESVNPTYPPISGEHARIIGVVVWSHRTEDTMRRFGR